MSESLNLILDTSIRIVKAFFLFDRFREGCILKIYLSPTLAIFNIWNNLGKFLLQFEQLTILFQVHVFIVVFPISLEDQ